MGEDERQRTPRREIARSRGGDERFQNPAIREGRKAREWRESQ